jgi:hypothetical protein
MPTGASVGYISGAGHVPLPAAGAGYRAAHTPAQRKPNGLDWAALRPKCTTCGTPSSELRDSLCPACTPTPVVATSTPATTGPTLTRTVDGRALRGAHVDRAEVVRLYTEGATVPRIHDQLGYAFGTIRRTLTAAGVELRDDRKHNGPRPQQVAS